MEFTKAGGQAVIIHIQAFRVSWLVDKHCQTCQPGKSGEGGVDRNFKMAVDLQMSKLGESTHPAIDVHIAARQAAGELMPGHI